MRQRGLALIARPRANQAEHAVTGRRGCVSTTEPVSGAYLPEFPTVRSNSPPFARAAFLNAHCRERSCLAATSCDRSRGGIIYAELPSFAPVPMADIGWSDGGVSECPFQIQ